MSSTETNNKTKLMVLSALLAAMIFLSVAYLFHIPVGANAGYVHLGDAFIYLAAVLLPRPYAFAAAAIGAGFADIATGSAIWAIPTMIIKPILVPFFTNKSEKIITKRNVLATIYAGILGTVLYMIAEGIMIGSMKAAFVLSLMSFVQPVGSAIVFVIIGLAFDKINIKEKYKL
ncbi:TIGR04002 family protein [Peptacetobacter sp.]|uniref:TIGR04002 family protein n=1 Tax=Peptacetobacter sp. TaxID=2991975 RepID=UPI002632DB20|nr:TIGR04002 family protein [Peptacetobacter sp.]